MNSVLHVSSKCKFDSQHKYKQFMSYRQKAQATGLQLYVIRLWQASFCVIFSIPFAGATLQRRQSMALWVYVVEMQG